MMADNFAFRIAALLLMGFAFAGVAFAGGRIREVPVDASVLARGQQCDPAPEGWRATWIASSEALGGIMKRCGSNRVGDGGGHLPAVDFGRFGVLAVEMGRRSSAGYGFKTDAVTAGRSKDTVAVTLTHVQPAPGAMTAQVMTSPWILIRLPLSDFQQIRVVDPDGVLLVQTELP